MEADQLQALLTDFCDAVGLPDRVSVVAKRLVYVKGMDVSFETMEGDAGHFQMYFRFGAIAPGRALRVFRLMLEANLLVYAKDNAHFGMDPDTGESVLMLRAAFGPETNGQWLANTLAHYAEHGLYWRNNILDSPDEQFNGVASREYQWIRV
ncbi:MAG: molecular chaperone Tir [Comamonadaceae bacterium]|nr:MAG: molecular chaperone Tir [Comamonadaceae bacterium]